MNKKNKELPYTHDHCTHMQSEYCSHCDEWYCQSCGKEWSKKTASLTYAGGGSIYVGGGTGTVPLGGTYGNGTTDVKNDLYTLTNAPGATKS